MPGCVDLTGQTFNYLTVIEKTNKRKRGNVVWKCRCKCGNEKEVTSIDLTHNRIMSCGCYNKEQVSKNFNNLLGQQFGDLTVVEKTEKRSSSREIIWKCKCSCGNITEVPSGSLLKKNGTQSCGCRQRKKACEFNRTHGRDLIGQKIGKLTPIELIYENNQRKYLCQCDCGTQKVILASNLRTGHTLSCGCLGKSQGEFIIATILEANNINYITRYHCDSCKFQSGYYAYFDFFVENKYIIEFDGMQHYINSDWWPEPLEKIQQRDNFKNNWCHQNNIPIIRIPYWHLKKICIADLKPESSNFLLTIEKQKQKEVNNEK